MFRFSINQEWTPNKCFPEGPLKTWPGPEFLSARARLTIYTRPRQVTSTEAATAIPLVSAATPQRVHRREHGSVHTFHAAGNLRIRSILLCRLPNRTTRWACTSPARSIQHVSIWPYGNESAPALRENAPVAAKQPQVTPSVTSKSCCKQSGLKNAIPSA